MSKNILVLVSILALIAGCQTNHPPRLRHGSSFGGIIGDYFLDPENLGKHQYKNGYTEKIGFVYTCKGGFIDIGHLHESADRTAYISRITFENLIGGENEFSFQVIEPTWYFVKIEYPKEWEELSEQEEIAAEISIKLGQYFAYMTTIWHEIITWFGFKSTGIFSEYVSSFSWEDTYSDLLGINLAAIALRDTQHKYDDAMTMLIDKELEKLSAQPPKLARLANKKIYGKFYTGGLYFFTTIKKRNFDTGLDDGFITPWLVPDICPDSEPKLYPVPNLNFLYRYGFSIRFEIEPRIAEKDKILSIIYPNERGKCIQPAVHFPIIIEYIKKEAVEKFGPQVDVADLS